MLDSKKDAFQLDPSVTYLNCAYMSPQLIRVTETGIQMLSRKSRPYEISADDFFGPVTQLKNRFARLVNIADPDRIALIPSVSYGIANVANNVQLEKGQKIVMVEEQFPSNYYSWKRLAGRYGGHVQMVQKDSAHQWNQAILDAIDENTRLVALAHVHWADGTLFDLKAIRKKTRQVGALLIIDGTQSVGALPFDVAEIQPDALICAGYKWLMGPYSLGLAYYGEYFDRGVPIEENWINRKHSENFSGLVNYEDEYHPKAWRYSVGEHSNFLLVPMLSTAIDQLLEWRPENIQAYCSELWNYILPGLQELGCKVETAKWRGAHLAGIGLDDSFDKKKLNGILRQNRVYVSLRGHSIRVSPHLYNDKEDMESLLDCFKQSKKISVY